MPAPRRIDVVSPERDPQSKVNDWVLHEHFLDRPRPEDSISDGEFALIEAFKELKTKTSIAEGPREDYITSHPLFHEVMREYASLVRTLLFSEESDEDLAPAPADWPGVKWDEDAELDEALKLWIEVLRSRKKKADEFIQLHEKFIDEYSKAVVELDAAVPAGISGSTVADKIEELKRTVKRKFGGKAEEVQRECVNKKRRRNLTEKATETLRTWFSDHKDNPYPSDAEKAKLARQCKITEEQVCNWFVNVRKRYWSK